MSGILPGPRQRSSGFTLIELLVVLAILGLATGMIVLWRPGGNMALADDAIAMRLVTGLRQARTEAMVSSRPTDFVLDPGTRRWQVVAIGSRHASVGELPDRMALRITSVSRDTMEGRVGTIRFLPDGSSSGAEIHLADGNWRRMIGVNWLTGRIVSDREIAQ